MDEENWPKSDLVPLSDSDNGEEENTQESLMTTLSSIENKNRSRERTNSPSDNTPLDQLLKVPAVTNLPALPSTDCMDILGNDDDELQKALQMSLQENGPNQQNEMSAEEKDLQRALAESMASHEAHQNPKKRSLERPERPPQLANPPKVDEDVPAGMRNVGSSCWFNCVLQVMHNIPSLREAIFHHDSSNSSEEFFALQKTMALLSTSKYSWVDPIDEVTLYRKLMPITPQQDAAEFLGKCIEICEKEFKNDNDSENITSLTSIYSGMLTVTGKDSKDQSFSSNEEFGPHFNIHVHQKMNLENALNGIEVNGKETWIKTLPQVLFLNLNRFEYNRDLQMPQKSNERLEFKEEIFMDRYLSQNQDLARKLHREQQSIEEKLVSINNAKTVLTKRGDMNVNRALQTVIDMCDDCVTESSNSQNLLPDVSKDDMSSVKSVLSKWNENIKAENSKLSEMGTGLRSQRRSLFSKEALRQERFFLSAVIVHMGQAGAGHYWVYILRGGSWWRINDNDVKKCEFFDIEKESFGGTSGSSSAYILVYQKDGGTVVTEDLAPALQEAVLTHDQQQMQRANEGDPVSSVENDPYSVNVINSVPAFSNTDAAPFDMCVETDDNNMEIDEVISNRLSPLEIQYSEHFEDWLQKNCGFEQIRFFRNDFIDSMTYDLQSKRHLKFASFLDEIGKKEEHSKFLKELKNKTLLEHYPKISTLHALHAATYEDIVLALMTWDGGNCTAKGTLLALDYAESAIYDQIWFSELNDMACEEINMPFFFDALSRLLTDATQTIMNAFEAGKDAEVILRKLDTYLNIFLYLNKSINHSTEYRDDKMNEIKQSVDSVRAKWFNLSSSLESASLPNFIERLFLEECNNCNSKRRSRDDQESWNLRVNPKTTMKNYSSLFKF